MATAAKIEDEDDTGGEYKRPDAKTAIKIYKEEIAPKNAHMATIRGDLSDPHKRIKDECHFPRSVLDFLVRLDDMEEAKRDHWLLALNLGLSELNLNLPRDLVTIANGEDGGPVIPAGKRAKPKLATIMGQPSTGMETDLADAADFDEPAPGTGAAAIAAMKATARGYDEPEGAEEPDGSQGD